MFDVKSFRAAVIGCGKIGYEFGSDTRRPGVYSHAQAYATHPRTQLVGVCDLDLARAQGCAATFPGPKAFSDYRTMLDTVEPELISICTPDESHVELLRGALESKHTKAVLCEKPLALSTTEAIGIADLARERGKVIAVNYTRRYDAAHWSLRNDIAGGRIGAVKAVTGFYGKGLRHNGSHWLDLVRFLVGDPHWVEAEGTPWGFGEDRTLTLSLGLDRDARAYLVGTDHEAYTIFEMDILGSAGRVRLTEGGRAVSYYFPRKGDVVAGYSDLPQEPDEVVSGLQGALPAALDNIVAHVETGESLRCSAADGVAVLKIADAAAKSQRTGERVWLRP